MKQKLLTAGKRIAELETRVGALKAEEKTLRESGDKVGADELAGQVKDCEAELEEQHKLFDDLLEQSNAEAVSRKQTEDYWKDEFSSMISDTLNKFVFWMQTNRLEGSEQSLWDMFMQENQ